MRALQQTIEIKNIITIVLVLISAGLLGLTWRSSHTWSIIWGLFFLLLFIVFPILQAGKDDVRLFSIFSIALFSRLGLLLFRPELDLGGDEVLYNYIATVTSQNWAEGQLGRFHGLSAWYADLLGLQYFVFGDTYHIARLFNVGVGIYLIWFVHRFVLHLTGDKQGALFAAMLIAFFPLQMEFDTLVRKDTLVSLTLLASIYSYFRWRTNMEAERDSRWFLAMLLSLGALLLLRSVTAYALITLAILLLAIEQFQKSRGMLAIVLVAVLVAVFVIDTTQTQWLSRQFTWYLTVSETRQLERLDSVNSTAANLISGRGLGSLSTYLILLIRNFLIPHPFHWIRNHSWPTVALSISGFFWFSLFVPLSLFGVLKKWNELSVKFLSIFTLLNFMILSFPAVALVAEPIRYRMPYYPLLAVLAGIGLSSYLKANKEERNFGKMLFVGSQIVLIFVSLIYIRSNL